MAENATNKLKLQEKKSARIKLQILHCTLELIGDGSFKDVSIEQITAKVEISRGTFFNYFAQKEDIMFYFFEIWSLRRAVEQMRKPKTGLAAIRHLFKEAAKIYKEQPGVALSIVSFIANLRRKAKRIEIGFAERTLLFPEVEGVGALKILRLHEMFDKHIAEAIEAGEINPGLTTGDITHFLEMTWYGGFLTAHASGADIAHLYNLNLKWLCSSVLEKTGSSGLCRNRLHGDQNLNSESVTIGVLQK